MPFSSVDHVQLAMAAGEEEKARAFYRDLLGMVELAKPPELAKQGGCWFASGGVQIHLGVERDFRPAKKAHPALRCRNYKALLNRLRSAGIVVEEAEDVPSVRRC
jgi:catechol 2,3-dioxygenase-like lactoylglutathione lyase family enzyme